MNIIYDFEGFGKSNLNLEIGKTLVKVSGVSATIYLTFYRTYTLVKFASFTF